MFKITIPTFNIWLKSYGDVLPYCYSPKTVIIHHNSPLAKMPKYNPSPDVAIKKICNRRVVRFPAKRTFLAVRSNQGLSS